MSEPTDTKIERNKDLAIDFTTSSSISRVNIKFLAVYIPIFWLSGILCGVFWYEWTKNHPPIQEDWEPWVGTLVLLPYAIFCMFFIFILSCLFLSKLFLILVNLIHKPKEGVFKAEIGDADFEFWCLRTELKKLTIWLVRNCPVPWLDTLVFRWFGLKIDTSSHLQDSWSDTEFIDFGRRVLVGQGAVVMSSMVVGKYLIIKRIILDDYSVIGGLACVSPGTITGKDTLLGAASSTILNQTLETGWIYFGIPAIKLKLNKLTYVSKITTSNIDDEEAVQEEKEVNIDEDKKEKLRKI